MSSQIKLFDDDKIDWTTEWKDMPEFVQMDKLPIKSVVVHFETMDDIKLFSKLVGKNITPLTKSLFFPIKQKTPKAYIDES